MMGPLGGKFNGITEAIFAEYKVPIKWKTSVLIPTLKNVITKCSTIVEI